MELLSPAGSFDCLRAAVQNGADAVYLGLKEFSARSSAENFTRDSLQEAVFYCHTRGVKVHLALNTLMDEADLDRAVEIGIFAQNAGVDALIIQDLGLAKRLRTYCTLPLHASTQMTIYNASGLAQIKALGFTRCIPARELSLSEIKQLCDMQLMEIEVFVHGALCMSYSGQCLFSFFLGGRSGNKGNCAQPCRLPYTIYMGDRVASFSAKPAYHLSPQDLCTLPFLDRLIATGVRSLKIEGRLKGPEYVAIVTRKYRDVIDKIRAGEVPFYTTKDLDDLALSFCRTGFTSGHMLGKMPSSSITQDTPGRTGLLCGKTLSAPRKREASVPVFDVDVLMDKSVRKGDGLVFRSADKRDRVGQITEGIVNVVRSNGVDCGDLPQNGKMTLTIAGKDFSQKACKIFKTYDHALFSDARQSYTPGKEYRKVPITGVFHAHPEEQVILTVTDPEGHKIVCHGQPPEMAKKEPTSQENIYSHLDTLGNTPYKWKELIIDVMGNIFLPVSALKRLRRESIDKLTEKRTEIKQKSVQICTLTKKNEKVHSILPGQKEDISCNIGHAYTALFYRSDDFMHWSEKESKKIHPLKRIYLPTHIFNGDRVDDKFLERLSSLRLEGVEIFGILPWVNKSKSYDRLIKNFDIINAYTDGYLAQNVGDAELISKYAPHHKKAADLSLNACNSESVAEFGRLGFDSVTLSPETTSEAVWSILNCSEKGMLCGAQPEFLYSGPIPVMRSEHCMIGTASGNIQAEHCGLCTTSEADRQLFYIGDRVGHKYPVLCDKESCRMMILYGDRVDAKPRSQMREVQRYAKIPCLFRINILYHHFSEPIDK